MLITPSIKEHQLDTNQLRHQLGTNQMAPLPGIEPGSDGAIATATARDESNGAVAGDRTSNQMVPLPLPLLGTNQVLD